MLSDNYIQAFVALGGNQGNVLETFRVALNALEGRDVVLTKVSSAYRTVALTTDNCSDLVPDYWNAVLEIRTNLSPRTLLENLLLVERSCGRVRSRKWASRPLDLDLLVYEDCQIDEVDLVVPHPRMRERAFVMRPLCEIASDLLLPPDGRSVKEIRAELTNPEDGILEVVPFGGI